MSKVYVHSRKYRRRSRLLSLGLLASLLILVIGGLELYFHRGNFQAPAQTAVLSQSTVLNGYISPYFLFKDSAKWVQDKADSTPSLSVYNEYIGGQPVRQLIIYMNQTPNNTILAATRVLTVKVVGGDSLAAGSLSAPCASLLPPNQPAVQPLTVNHVNMICEPNPKDYSVILGLPGGNYVLKMSTTKTTTNFIVIYRDLSGHPDPQQIINIANSFKAI